MGAALLYIYLTSSCTVLSGFGAQFVGCVIGRGGHKISEIR